MVLEKFTGKERASESGLDYFGAKVLREWGGEVCESGLVTETDACTLCKA